MLYFENKKRLCTFTYKASEKIYKKYGLPVGFQFYTVMIFEPWGYIPVQKSQLTSIKISSPRINLTAVCMYCMLTVC